MAAVGKLEWLLQQKCPGRATNTPGLARGGLAPLDTPNDTNHVIVRLHKTDAPVLLELVLSLLRHPSTCEPERSAALVSVACQLRRAVKIDPA